MDIFSYIGINLKNYLITVALKFGFYMTLLFVSVMLFLRIPVLTGSVFVFCIYALIIIATDIFLNNVILKTHSLSFLNQFYLFHDKVSENLDSDPPEWKRSAAAVKKELKTLTYRFIPSGLIEVFTVFSVNSRFFTDMKNERIKMICRNYFGWMLIRISVELIAALPFFLISFFLTFGHKAEMIMFSMIPALLFFLFIRSALIKPVFSLLAFRSIHHKNSSTGIIDRL